jgi:hypothetical protein
VRAHDKAERLWIATFLLDTFRGVKSWPQTEATIHGKIQASLLAYDRVGNAVNWVGVTQGMDLKPEIFAAIQKSGIPVHLEIDLPNSEVYLETGVYDWSSGKAGTLEVPVNDIKVAAAAKQ